MRVDVELNTAFHISIFRDPFEDNPHKSTYQHPIFKFFNIFVQAISIQYGKCQYHLQPKYNHFCFRLQPILEVQSIYSISLQLSQNELHANFVRSHLKRKNKNRGSRNPPNPLPWYVQKTLTLLVRSQFNTSFSFLK